MWRKGSGTKLETKFLDEVLETVETDPEIAKKVSKTLAELEKKYPELAYSLDSPQSDNKHAEGPRVRDHIRMILTNLTGLLEGKFHLLEIEELARLKGYAGELEELEETIKERASFFKAFALLHDIGKGAAARLIAKPGTKGYELGFTALASAAWGEFGGNEREVMLKKYWKLYQDFAKDHPDDPPEVQLAFFKEYKISVSNWGHAHAAYDPRFQDTIMGICKKYRVAEVDIGLLMDLISFHMHPLHLFRTAASPGSYESLVDQATRRGYDADDFMDLLGGVVLIDKVFGAKSIRQGRRSHNPQILINMLKAEHDWAPQRRVKQVERQELELEANRRQVLRNVGLDGEAVMQLTGLSPGPELGKLLRDIRAVVEGEGELPKVKRSAKKVLETRVQEAKLKFDQMI